MISLLMRTPGFSLHPNRWFLVLALAMLAVPGLGQQRGQIIKPATLSVMDPNEDGFISISPSGFTGTGFSGYYGDEFEFPMFGIPIVGDGEALADNQAGPACGISDLTVDSLGFGAYAVLKDGYLTFRFRIGDHNSSVESYSILIDTDGKMGTDDPNSTPENPGFEIDITLIKNVNKGIFIYNIDGIESCPTPLRNYSFDSNFQIAIADIITCSDLDYFYDYFVPFTDLEDLFGVTGATEMRIVAVTNMSGTCAMAGRISDIGGVDDTDYAGCVSCAFLDLGTNQCPTSVENLCGTCSGFQSGVTPKPTINTPVKAGENTLSGTAVGNATIFVDLLNSSNVLQETVTTSTAVTGCTIGCPWSVTFTQVMEPGDIISARARSVAGCSSGSVSSDATIEIVVVNVPPQLSATTSAISYTENGAPLVIDGTILIIDPDNTVMEGATVSISANFVAGEDLLTFTPVAGVSGAFNSTTGDIQFTGVATVAAYQSLLRSISYSNTSENPSTVTRSVSFQIFDGLDNSNIVTRPINVISVNDPPVAVGDGGTVAEDGVVSIANISANDTDVDGTVVVTSIDLDPNVAGQQTTSTLAQGTWVVDATGQVTFTPTANFNGTAARSYTIQDNAGSSSNTATITVQVTAVNDAPVATNDAGSTNEDIPVTLNGITANDTDIDGTIDVSTVDLDLVTAGIQSTLSDAQGAWTVTGGNLNYSPGANFNGTASISYQVADNGGALSNVATITVNVIPMNDAPVAVPDNGITDEDTPVTLPNIASNDTDIDGTVDVTTIDLDPVTAGQQTTFTGAFGQLTVNGAGEVTFTPVAQFNGTVIRPYTVRDNGGIVSNSANITITVNSVNDLPVANDDTGVTNQDLPVTLPGITGNDTDIDGTVDATTVDLDPSTGGKQSNLTNAHGTWSVNANGDVTYSPATGFNGNGSATYTVNDNTGGTSNVATLLVVVIAANIPPVAVNDAGTTNEDTPVTVLNVTSNDTDADGTINIATVDIDPVAAGIQTSITTTQGSWSVNSSGDVLFTPVAEFSGTASQIYTVQDNSGAVSNPATISVTVNPVNDLPVAVNDSGVTNEDVPVTLAAITANDTDIDGTVDPTSLDLDLSTAGQQANFSNSQGTWSVDAGANLTFTPAAGFFGNASATYVVNDNAGGTSNVATISIVVNEVIAGNTPPVATNDTGSTNEETPVTLVNVTSNDTDADGTINPASVDLDPVTAGLQTNITTAQGAWTVNSASDVTFTPAAGFTGVASQIYTVQDNLGATSNSASITITVNSVNDPPVAVNDSGVTNEDIPVTLLAITANDTDVDGTVDATTVDLDPSVGGTQNNFSNLQGAWSVNASGDVTFTPVAGFTGNASITYTVKDNSGATSNAATILVIVNDVVINSPPVAVNDTGTTDEETALTLLNVTSNDTDSDGTINPATVDFTPITAGLQTSITTPQGTWTVNPASDVTFTPVAGFTGIASQIYTVQDNQGATSNSAAISVTVNAVNDPPVAIDDSGATNEGTAVTLAQVTANDTDVDGTVDQTTVDLDPLTAGKQISLSTAQGLWEVDASGNVQFTPVSNFNGTAQATYTVNDNAGATSNVANLAILVNAINDLPVAVNDSGSTQEDTSVSLTDITANDSDVDGTIVKSSIDLDPATAGQQTTLTSAQGNWIVDPAGILTFTPAPNFNGQAVIQYTVDDNSGATSNSASVTITVNSVNDAPVAVADQGITHEDTDITLSNITSNDTDVDGTINAASIDLNPSAAGRQDMLSTAGGTWSVNAGGDLSFSPALNFNGTVAVAYTVQDNELGLSNTASVTIEVLAVNDQPVVEDLSFQTVRNQPIQESLLSAADTDIEGTVLSVNTTPTKPPDHGSIVIAANGSFTYTPATDYVGTDIVEVAFCDQGIPSPPACANKTVNFTVNPANNPPVVFVNGAPSGTLTISTLEDVPVILCFNAVDPDGDPVLIKSVVNVLGGGTLEPYGNISYCFLYTPIENFIGVSQWTLSACDNGGLCGNLSVTVNVLPINDPPLTLPDTITTLRNVMAYTNVLDNDYDVEGQAMTVTLTPLTPPRNGQVTLASNGDLQYKSNIQFRGTDSLTYEVCDSFSPPGCSQGKVIIIVEDLPLKVYEGVSPNGDGNNDYLRIDGIDFYIENQVQIFDRYNNLVFEVDGYNNEDKVWTGESNRGIGTRELPEETYFYAINLGDGSSLLTGFVVLKRR